MRNCPHSFPSAAGGETARRRSCDVAEESQSRFRRPSRCQSVRRCGCEGRCRRHERPSAANYAPLANSLTQRVVGETAIASRVCRMLSDRRGGTHRLRRYPICRVRSRNRNGYAVRLLRVWLVIELLSATDSELSTQSHATRECDNDASVVNHPRGITDSVRHLGRFWLPLAVKDRL